MKTKLNTSEAADYLGLKASTLEVWRCHGRGPAYKKLGRRVVYDVSDLEGFAQARTVHTVDAPASGQTIGRLNYIQHYTQK